MAKKDIAGDENPFIKMARVDPEKAMALADDNDEARKIILSFDTVERYIDLTKANYNVARILASTQPAMILGLFESGIFLTPVQEFTGLLTAISEIIENAKKSKEVIPFSAFPADTLFAHEEARIASWILNVEDVEQIIDLVTASEPMAEYFFSNETILAKIILLLKNKEQFEVLKKASPKVARSMLKHANVGILGSPNGAGRGSAGAGPSVPVPELIADYEEEFARLYPMLAEYASICKKLAVRPENAEAASRLLVEVTSRLDVNVALQAAKSVKILVENYKNIALYAKGQFDEISAVIDSGSAVEDLDAKIRDAKTFFSIIQIVHYRTLLLANDIKNFHKVPGEEQTRQLIFDAFQDTREAALEVKKLYQHSLPGFKKLSDPTREVGERAETSAESSAENLRDSAFQRLGELAAPPEKQIPPVPASRKAAPEVAKEANLITPHEKLAKIAADGIESIRSKAPENTDELVEQYISARTFYSSTQATSLVADDTYDVLSSNTKDAQTLFDAGLSLALVKSYRDQARTLVMDLLEQLEKVELTPAQRLKFNLCSVRTFTETAIMHTKNTEIAAKKITAFVDDPTSVDSKSIIPLFLRALKTATKAASARESSGHRIEKMGEWISEHNLGEQPALPTLKDAQTFHDVANRSVDDALSYAKIAEGSTKILMRDLFKLDVKVDQIPVAAFWKAFRNATAESQAEVIKLMDEMMCKNAQSQLDHMKDISDDISEDVKFAVDQKLSDITAKRGLEFFPEKTEPEVSFLGDELSMDTASTSTSERASPYSVQSVSSEEADADALVEMIKMLDDEEEEVEEDEAGAILNTIGKFTTR